MAARFDFVVYGATGFTGAYIVRALATNAFTKGKRVAVAGRSEAKLRQTLADISEDIGVNVRDWPVIVADSSDSESLAAMARQATVIINAVGPYRLYGDAVVAAAVENGAHHVDVSGEPAFLEKMVQLYGEKAAEKGVYVVGACGWDSIPCDLGVDFLKRHFDGTLGYVETFVENHRGPSGYSFNTGTYQTLILGIANVATDGLGKIRRQIMPERPPATSFKPPKRWPLFHVTDGASLEGRGLPFPGSDKSIVNRSQYYDYHANKKRPVVIETYFVISSLFNGLLLMLWLTLFAILAQFKWTRKFLQDYPDQASFGLFKNSGPTKQQMKEASFSYYVFGKGWKGEVGAEDPAEAPNKTATAVCRGPDPGYIGTAGCVVSAALAVLNDKAKLPSKGGVYTTASAFRNTRIHEYLKSFGITFEMLPNSKF